MSEPYEVTVSVPDEPDVSPQEKADLIESFRSAVVETLGAKGVTDVDVEIVMGGGGESLKSS